MKHSEQLDKLAPSLAIVQSIVKGAIKDSQNPFFKSKFADLESCWEALQKPLTDNGFSVIQGGSLSERGPMLDTRLLHTSGQWIEGSMPLIAGKDTPQDYGASITYFRRFGLCAITGLIQVDDDGESARQSIAQRHNTSSLARAPSSVPSNSQVSAAGGDSHKIPACPKCGKAMKLSQYEDAELKCVPWVCFCSKPAVKVPRVV